jgi:hypothetical protein
MSAAMDDAAPLSPETARETALDWRQANAEAMAAGLEWLARRMRATLTRTPEAERAADADALLRALIAAPEPAEPAPPDPARLTYEGRRADMAAAGAPAAIDGLSRLFGLSPFDEDVLLLALAPHASAGFEALTAPLQGAGAPTRHLALALFAGPDPAARDLARAGLAPDAPLRRWRLVEAIDADRGALARLALDERMADLLLGRDRSDPRVRACARPIESGPLPPSAAAPVAAFAAALVDAPPRGLILGPRGSGRHAAAAEAAAALGLGLLALRPDATPPATADDPEGWALLAREALLGGFAWAIDADRDDRAARALDRLEAPVFAIAAEAPDDAPAVPVLRLPPMTDADRAAILRATFGAGATAEAAERAAAQFRIGPRAVVRAARQANGSADLWRACRAACAAELSALGRRVAPRFGWDDLVLPDRTVAELRALAAQARARATVLRRWGFGARWGDAGASALFAGPSGAGKSMAAEAIARDLDLDLFRIDLSGVVSKYIGETEKNLRRVFETAEESGAVLLFDEADALFGKRSEVKDSHDRYANIEVSYLLEAMERYRGVAILTTNLKNHLDPAFQRRLSFVIDFPKPDAAARARLWRAAIPAAAPTEGLDIDRLARMELAGGSIARAALNAAYMAADAGEPLTMAHVLRAAEAEHRKLDREFRAP